MNEGKYVPADVSGAAAGLEDRLMAILISVTRQVSHAECFDEEQRAELYTILQTIRSDTQLHRQLVSRWFANHQEVQA